MQYCSLRSTKKKLLLFSDMLLIATITGLIVSEIELSQNDLYIAAVMLTYLVFSDILAVADWFFMLHNQRKFLLLFRQFHKTEILLGKLGLKFNIIPYIKLTVATMIVLSVLLPFSVLFFTVVSKTDARVQLMRVLAYGGSVIIKLFRIYYHCTFMALVAHRIFKLREHVCRPESRISDEKKLMLVAEVQLNLCDILKKANETLSVPILNLQLNLFYLIFVILCLLYNGKLERIVEFFYVWSINMTIFCVITFGYVVAQNQVFIF